LILTISHGVKKRDRLAMWLFHRAFRGVSLIFKDPYTLNLTTIRLPNMVEAGAILEPSTCKQRHEIKIVINPDGEEPLEEAANV